MSLLKIRGQIMSYKFSIDGRVDDCTIQDAIKKSFFGLPQIVRLYEVTVYLDLTINSNRLQEIIGGCEGFSPPFYPTEPENGLTYCFKSRDPLQVGDTIAMQFEYKNRKFSYIGSDRLLLLVQTGFCRPICDIPFG